jgi:quercetin dioxygenase-like cupin family protein
MKHRMTSRFVSRLRTAAALVAAAVPAFALAVVTTAGDKAIHIPGERTRQAFETGQALLENDAFKVHASRRTAPGLAEIHTADTDIIYVLEGTATIVTGGTVVDGNPTAPHELRGRVIEGGRAQRLGKGDVFIVPNGTPHQFTEVDAPFLYYVVKTTDTNAAGGAH